MTGLPEQEVPHYAEDNLHMHKGEEVLLNKVAPVLHKIIIGLGWQAPEQEGGHPVDIDASAFLLGPTGRVRRDTDFVFYNNLETENGTVRHWGDNTTGAGAGDDEVIRVDLDALPFDVDRIAFSVTIHNAEERAQSFGIIHKAYIRIVSEEDGRELAHYDLSEDASSDDAMIFGELVRDSGGWKFRALGAGSAGGLYKIARDYGVNVAPG